MTLPKESMRSESIAWLEGKTIVFVGDSITAETKSNYVTLTLEALAEEIDVTKLKIVNSSVDSSSILDALDRLPDILYEFRPDAFIIFLGINDSKIFYRIDRPLLQPEVFQESYAAFIRRADADQVRKKILITLPPLLFDEIRMGDFLADYWYWKPELYDQYNVAIRNIAKDFGCALADAYLAFARVKNRRLFNEDGVHPNIYGHRLIAREVLSALEGFGR